MNPWPIVLNVLGWAVLALIAIILAAGLIGIIATAVKKVSHARRRAKWRRREHQILDSELGITPKKGRR